MPLARALDDTREVSMPLARALNDTREVSMPLARALDDTREVPGPRARAVNGSRELSPVYSSSRMYAVARESAYSFQREPLWALIQRSFAPRRRNDSS